PPLGVHHHHRRAVLGHHAVDGVLHAGLFPELDGLAGLEEADGIVEQGPFELAEVAIEGLGVLVFEFAHGLPPFPAGIGRSIGGPSGECQGRRRPPQSIRATARTGEPSAWSRASGRAMNRQRIEPMRCRLVRYSITVIPAGKKMWCVVQSSGRTFRVGSKMLVRTEKSGG